MSAPSLCWRHSARLFWAAFGSLLDLSGKSYRRFSRPVIEDSKRCPACLIKGAWSVTP